MSQLPTPKEAETPLGFTDQKSRIRTVGGAELDAGERQQIVMKGMGRGRRVGRTDMGGSKCQVPLGSGDGRYIYQSKQPRGAEYFTCRRGLLHYHHPPVLPRPILTSRASKFTRHTKGARAMKC